MTTIRGSGLSIHTAWPHGLTLSVALFGLAACAQSAPAQPDIVSTTAPTATKVSPILKTVAQQLINGGSPSEFNSGLVHVDSRGRLQIYVYINDFSLSNLATLATQGLVDSMPSSSLHLIQGWVKPQDLDKLASLAFVTRITPPHYAQTR